MYFQRRKTHHSRSARKASRSGLGFCPEDRKTDGIIGAASVRKYYPRAASTTWLVQTYYAERTRNHRHSLY